VTGSSDNTARVWDVARTEAIARERAVVMTAALARGIGTRTDIEAVDLLMQDAPDDMFAEALAKLSSEQSAAVEDVIAALRVLPDPNRYLSPTQYAEKFGAPLTESAISLTAPPTSSPLRVIAGALLTATTPAEPSTRRGWLHRWFR
jgi:hypothetical protein